MNKKIVPNLRFPEFKLNEKWKKKKLGEFCDVLMCKRIFTHQTSEIAEIPFFKIGTLGGVPDAFISKDLFESYKSKYSYPKVGEVLVTCSGTVGKCLPFDGQDAYYQDSNIVWISNPTLEISNTFLLIILQNIDWAHLSSTTITRIYGADLRNLDLYFPACNKEQAKVSECLSSLNTLIDTHEKRVNSLETYKRGLLQKLFPAFGEATPRLRFLEFKKNGNWKKDTLNNLATIVTTKNNNFEENRVLTNSAAYGVIDQREFFKKDIAQKSNLNGYYLINKGDFVYNPRVSNLAPVGPISRNNLGTGVMSPLYTIFRFKEETTDFFEHFFKSSHWHSYLQSSSNQGARHDRMAISNELFMKMPIYYPDNKEQQKIADFLSNLDNLIKIEEKKINLLRTHKKGLIQQLFPVLKDEEI